MKRLILAGLLLWGAFSFARAEGNDWQVSAGDGARIRHRHSNVTSGSCLARIHAALQAPLLLPHAHP